MKPGASQQMSIIKQYVNLPSSAAHPERGNRRRLQVTPNTVPNVNPGDQVEWWIEPRPGNTELMFVRPSQRPRLQSPDTHLTAASGRFENTITLPQTGGDRFVVKVARLGDRANFLQTDEFQTWRKLYYTVFYMGNGVRSRFDALRADFEEAFKDGFVELEQVQMVAAATQMARVDATPRRRHGQPRFDFLRPIIGLSPYGHTRLAHKPFHVALLVVPNLYVLEEKILAMVGSRSVSGTTTLTYQLHTDPSNPLAFVRSATVRWRGHRAIDVSDKLSTPRMSRSRDSELIWALHTVPGLTHHLAAATTNTFTLDITLVSESTASSYASSNFCIVGANRASGEFLTRSPGEFLSSLTHEVGHTLGLTVREEARWDVPGNNWLSALPNTFWHSDPYGGTGDHCTTRARLASAPASEGLTTGQWYQYAGSGHLCTMFWSTDSHRDPQGRFCENCVPTLKRLNMDSASLSSAARDWNYFG